MGLWAPFCGATWDWAWPLCPPQRVVPASECHSGGGGSQSLALLSLLWPLGVPRLWSPARLFRRLVLQGVPARGLQKQGVLWSH